MTTTSPHKRFNPEEIDYRTPYHRDVDRIIHSKAYSRYVDKTQVVYLIDNDHITHRGLHVQLVSNFARGIAEFLGLKNSLVEAIALGHDVGHPPFGHEGEQYLSQLSVESGNRAFCHPVQSCRLLTQIEPLNLGLEVYDGFLCHDGGLREPVLRPVGKKTWDDHFAEIEAKLNDPDQFTMPMTREGCLVKICDTISYLGRDIEDAIHLGLIERKEIPQTCLGTCNKEILNRAAKGLIVASTGTDVIQLPEEVFNAIGTLRQFNFTHIYQHPRLKTESEKVKRSYRILFHELLADFEAMGPESFLGRDFGRSKSAEYMKNTSPVQMVIDYISGMTDSYFLRTFREFIVPKEIKWA